MGQASFLHNEDPCRQVIGTAGSKANYNGDQAEAVIFCILKERGYTIERQAEICEGIYGTTIKCDFLVHGIKGFSDGLVIEAKYQGSNGSADEKYPYLVENIRRRFPCPCIIVLGGGAMRPGAVKWLKTQVDGQKLVGVYTFEEFITWAIKRL